MELERKVGMYERKEEKEDRTKDGIKKGTTVEKKKKGMDLGRRYYRTWTKPLVSPTPLRSPYLHKMLSGVSF
jgi:hypothetical protein